MLIDLSDTTRNRVAARFLDGRVIKGFAQNFNINRDAFEIQPFDDSAAGAPITIQLSALKAIFFVKDLTSTSRTGRAVGLDELETFPSQRRLVVRFRDGEVIAGATCGYSPDRLGFFLFPLNPTTNNARVFVLRHALESIRFVGDNENLDEILMQMEDSYNGLVHS